MAERDLFREEIGLVEEAMTRELCSSSGTEPVNEIPQNTSGVRQRAIGRLEALRWVLRKPNCGEMNEIGRRLYGQMIGQAVIRASLDVAKLFGYVQPNVFKEGGK